VLVGLEGWVCGGLDDLLGDLWCVWAATAGSSEHRQPPGTASDLPALKSEKPFLGSELALLMWCGVVWHVTPLAATPLLQAGDARQGGPQHGHF
jgi:hypothetical protein